MRNHKVNSLLVLTPDSPKPRKFIAQLRPSGFSLVEVVLAVGIIAFAFVAILGLLPAGLHQFRQAMDTSISAQIAQRVIEDAQQTDFDTLVDAKHHQAGSVQPIQANSYSAGDTMKSSPIHTRYFDEQGNEIIPQSTTPVSTELAKIVYFVNTRILPATTLPGVQGDPSVVNTGLATVTVQVAFNPGGFPLKFDQQTLLVDITDPGMKRLSIRNYIAQLGRTE